jgi:hypothetical protein
LAIVDSTSELDDVESIAAISSDSIDLAPVPTKMKP